MPNALLVYPECPPSYWGGNFALEIFGIKAAHPPLGLLTVAAMFPSGYELRVVDMNVSPLCDSDLEWADLVFTSTMIVQRGSLRHVIERSQRAGLPIVAGGPHPSSYHQEIQGVDHFLLGEVEEIFPAFLRDLENGTAKPIYRELRKPDVTRTPVPRYDLIDPGNYHAMCVQFSRGCPFDCEFCDITKLYGRVARTKSPAQIVEEFEFLHRLGWRGQVFLVDDNFIGNKRAVLELLPVLADWQRERGYPFSLFTEASVNLARMDAVMDAMIEAGFDSVFVGIETPNPEALAKTKKPQNISRAEDNYLLNAVRKIQCKGMQVMGGFILGLDGDGEGVFDAQIEFIQRAGIPMAMVGLLTALRETNLYHRLKRENRLREDVTEMGDRGVINLTGVNSTVNFEPEMEIRTLLEGYRRVITTIYDPALDNYFARCVVLLERLKPIPSRAKRMSKSRLSVAFIAVRRRLTARQVPAFMKFITKVSRDHPDLLEEAIRLAALGYHFERVTSQQIAINDFRDFLAEELQAFTAASSQDPQEAVLTRAQRRCESIPDNFRYHDDGVEEALTSFRTAVGAKEL